MKNPLVAQFGKEKRWVNFRFQEAKGKTTKVPYDIHGSLASSTDEKSWATYADAKKASPQYGIIFTPAQDLLGIDIDHCINRETLAIEHEAKEMIALLILEADTYTELSPSGTGIHLFLKLTAPLKLTANKHAPFEAYTSGRYFTVTEKPYGEARDVRTVTPETAHALLELVGYPWGKGEPEDEAAVTTDVHMGLDDRIILEKMAASKNGAKVQKLYDGDITAYKDDASTADMALLSHLAFWTRKDVAQMERLWMRSPLGSRKKTQEREDYRKRSIANAIKACAEIYEPKRHVALDDGLDLLYYLNSKKDKVFIQNTENISRVLVQHLNFAGKFRYDMFKNAAEYDDGGWRPVEDRDVLNIQTGIQVLFPFFATVGKDMVFDAILKVCRDNQMNSAQDYLKGVAWDGECRLDTWLSKVYGCPDDVYHKAVGSNWMKGLVNRIMHPGCKFDYVLVIEGQQGLRKSTSLAVLGGNWHVETVFTPENKDFFMLFGGKAIVEFSEGETLSRTEAKRMKAIITMQFDKYRPPYERTTKEFPRQCIFAMTTNQDQYLKDETGNRRWLPVKCLRMADIDWLGDHRDQLFAEAFHRLMILNETTYDFPELETLEQQQMRQTTDPRFEQVYDWYYALSQVDRDKGITTREAYVGGVLGGAQLYREMGKLEEMVVSSILQNDMKLEKRRTMVSRQRFWKYYESERSAALSPQYGAIAMPDGSVEETRKPLTLDDF